MQVFTRLRLSVLALLGLCCACSVEASPPEDVSPEQGAQAEDDIVQGTSTTLGNVAVIEVTSNLSPEARIFANPSSVRLVADWAGMTSTPRVSQCPLPAAATPFAPQNEVAQCKTIADLGGRLERIAIRILTFEGRELGGGVFTKTAGRMQGHLTRASRALDANIDLATAAELAIYRDDFEAARDVYYGTRAVTITETGRTLKKVADLQRFRNAVGLGGCVSHERWSQLEYGDEVASGIRLDGSTWSMRLGDADGLAGTLARFTVRYPSSTQECAVVTRLETAAELAGL